MTKAQMFKEYYDLKKEEEQLKKLFLEVAGNLKVDEEKGIEILLIGPGYGRLEIPLLDVLFAKLGKIDFKISVIEPVPEMLQEFKTSLEIISDRYDLRERVSLKYYEDRFENIDLNGQKFNFVSIFFVLQYIDSQLDAIKKLNDSLLEDGLIIWGEEKGWLSFVDGINSDLDHIPEEWKSLWEIFHSLRKKKGKPYINPIKASDHSLIEFIYKNLDFENSLDKTLYFEFKEGISIDELKKWFDHRLWLPLFLFLSEPEYKDIYQELMKNFTDFTTRSEGIRFVSFIKKNSPEENIKYHELISTYLYHNHSFLNNFLFDGNVSSDDIFKQINFQNDFHSNAYEEEIIEFRLDALSHYLFRLLNKRIHFDYVLWQPAYGNFYKGSYIHGLPIAYLNNEPAENEKIYFSWYIFYFLSRRCLNIKSTFIDFVFTKIPYFDEININRKEIPGEVVKEKHIFFSHRNILEINLKNLDYNHFDKIIKDYSNLILELSDSLIKIKEDIFYKFDQIFLILDEFNDKRPDKFEKIKVLLEEEYNKYYGEIGGDTLREKIITLLEPYSCKIASHRDFYDDFIKNLFCLNFINKGDWKKINYKLGFTSKKEKEFEGYHIMAHICPSDLVEDEIIDVTLNAVLPLFSAKDGLYVSNRLIKQEVSKNATKSAIAAIMSRNMSHNIGSHILSALGYEGISAAEDRILFKYLQQRMDYIAQISTEMPKWTYSTWFLNDIMKWFYKQKNLLDYIARSEGLKSHYWEEQTEDRTIVIKIRNSTKKGEEKFIIPPGTGDKNPLKDDFQVAVPGGIAGLHAFYTILENFIRNSSKHEWSRKKEGNLEITIDFDNDPQKNYVVFTIFDNVSDIAPGKEEKESLPLDARMNKILTEPFINDVGELQKKNWGLGEMRISAGYLNKKDSTEIGMGSQNILLRDLKNNKPTGFIKAIPISTSDHNSSRLGYQFIIPKPKEVLIIGNWLHDIGIKINEEEAKKSGVYFKEKPDSERDYNFVLLHEDAIKTLLKKEGEDSGSIFSKLDHFTARILAVPGQKRAVAEKMELKKRLAYLDTNTIINLVKSENADKWEELNVFLYRAWVDNIISYKGIDGLSVCVNLEEGNGSKSDKDFQKIRKYYKIEKIKEMSTLIFSEIEASIQINDSTLNEFLQKFIEEKIDESGEEKILNERQLTLPAGNEISDNLKKKYLNKKKKFLKIAENTFKDYEKNIIDFIPRFTELFKNAISISIESFKDLVIKEENEIDTLPKIFASDEVDESNSDSIFNDLKSNIGNYLKKVKGVKKESEANIIYFRHSKKNYTNKEYFEELSGSQIYFSILSNCLFNIDNKYLSQKIALGMIENALLKMVIVDERLTRFCEKNKNVRERYRRMNIDIPIAVCWDKYVGISYLSTKKKLNDLEKKIEEREKKKQARDISEIEFFFDKDENDIEVKTLKDFDKDRSKGIDILIIHQGILDKMKFEISNSDDNVEKFIEALKKKISFVFVTSGRGKPANLPENAKFLPFSAIETFLIKEYPEKFLLTQLAMQIFLEGKS